MRGNLPVISTEGMFARTTVRQPSLGVMLATGLVISLFLESHAEIIGARLRPGFTHSICVLSAARVAGEISIQEWWSVRRCRNQHVIAVDVDAERGCPLPVETHRIHSTHL